MFSYCKQKAWVVWASKCSDQFIITNGVGQGKVLSPAMWSLYLLPLIQKIRNLGLGCHIGEVNLCSVYFADDINLISPSRSASVIILSTCEEWAHSNGVMFSTDPIPEKSKTKVMVVGAKDTSTLAPLTLYNADLPFVKKIKHVGHTFNHMGDMSSDVSVRKAAYLQRSNDLREQFSFCHPRELMKIIQRHCHDWYGAMLWDLGNPYMKSVYNLSNTMVKLLYDLPFGTHMFITNYMREPHPSIKESLALRYVKFFVGLSRSPSKEVIFLVNLICNDVTTTTGKNLKFVTEMCGEDVLQVGRNTERLRHHGELSNDQLDLLENLDDVIGKRLELTMTGDVDETKLEHLDDLINGLCSS